MFWLRLFVIACFCFSGFHSQAQESVTQETNAPYIKWYQVNTPNFRILYPKGFDEQAQRVANTLETIREPESKTMGVLPKKISIILQNQSSLSNGFVTLAPRRSEFYTMPAQNYNFIGTNDWLNNLAVHEYRHIVQFQRSVTGFNKLVYSLFGQQVLAGFAFAAAPQWFWEGDAVATETAFTPSGRGRIPNFDMLFRTNLMEGRTFNYHKQYLRSFKNNIPNHYVLGYNMVSYLRKKTNDPQIWEKISGRSWNLPFIPFTFSNAIKKETGMHVKDLYKEMAADRKKDYEEAIKGLEFNSFETLTQRKSSAYTDYLYPQPMENGKILAVKSGIGDIETLVVLSQDGKEEKRYVQGIINDAGMLSATHSRVVWNEFRFDPRWPVHTFSVLKGYDFDSKTTRIISSKSRYAAAAISPDGYKVVTIESTIDYQVRMIILDYMSGRILKVFSNPSNDQLAMPRWTPDGKSIVVLRVNGEGKTISRIDAESGSSEDLLPVSHENVGYPVVFHNYIFFNSPVSGIDNIYAVDLSTRERFQVTSSKFGAFNFSVDPEGKTIYYNNQSRDGMDVARMPYDPASWKKYEAPASSPNFLFQHLVEQEGYPDLLKGISKTAFQSKRYHKASGMINPHSWGPFFVNNLTNVNVGITSQDILSTTVISAGYQYDINERTGSWNAGVSYQGFYPIIDFQASMADRISNEGDINYDKKVGNNTATVTENLTFTWSEKTVQTGLRVPLNTTTSKYYGNITFADYVGLTSVTDFKNSIDGGGRLLPAANPQYFYRDYVDNGKLYYNHFSLSAYRLLKKNRRDIYSKWGQSINVDFFNTPYGGNFTGRQSSVYGLAYFPGLAKHHSIWGYWAYQYSLIPQANLTTGEGLDNYTFRNQIPLPRGQSVSRYQNMYSMSANYTLPLWYPDIAIGPLINFQRLRANVFYDYGFGSSTFPTASFNQTYSSIGGELKLDINILRFLPQFNVGVRYTYGNTSVNPARAGYPYSHTTFEILIGSFNF